MLCPVCKTIPLEDKELELGLKGYVCNRCGGNWLRRQDYEAWRETDAQLSSICCDNSDYSPEYDNKSANFCPDCGRILIKYKVSGNLPFYVDHCGTCNGIWFDKYEWESIVKNGLHEKVKNFFTEAWQTQIKKEMTRQRFEDIYRQKFGELNYNKLKELRKWIYESDKKGEIIAFLIDEDPYRL
jgi:Zn-finger nucleic acid-binding protein